MSVLINEAFSTESNITSVERLEMKFAKQANDVGFSLEHQIIFLKTLVFPLYLLIKLHYSLNIYYILSDELEIYFANPESFISSPLSYIAIDKSLNTDKLKNGCSYVSLYAYNEITQTMG